MRWVPHLVAGARGRFVRALNYLEMALALAGEAAASRELHMFSALFLPLPLQLGTAVTHQGWQWWGVFALGADLHRTPSALTLLLHLLFAAHHSHPVGEHTAEW